MMSTIAPSPTADIPAESPPVTVINLDTEIFTSQVTATSTANFLAYVLSRAETRDRARILTQLARRQIQFTAMNNTCRLDADYFQAIATHLTKDTPTPAGLAFEAETEAVFANGVKSALSFTDGFYKLHLAMLSSPIEDEVKSLDLAFQQIKFYLTDKVATHKYKIQKAYTPDNTVGTLFTPTPTPTPTGETPETSKGSFPNSLAKDSIKAPLLDPKEKQAADDEDKKENSCCCSIM